MQFVDTNVLLYAVSTAPVEAAKKGVATNLLRARDLCLSAQVLQEFYVQSTRETREDRLSHTQAASLVESFTRFPIQAITSDIVRAALQTRDRYQISYWDSAIVEAARALRSPVVLSEDLSHGQDYGGVQVHNPFLATV